jgi:hypothetical protein
MHPELLNKTVITEYLTREAPWAWSHGADQDYLGLGLLYYALVYALKARVAVCLGSGGGFVPRLMRQAQRDLGIGPASRTILVDGNNPAAGWGAPNWLPEGSFFRRFFPDVETVIDSTGAAARTYFARNGIAIDYLHIDADHSFQGCLEDFETYRGFLHEGSLVTLHDTNLPGAGVKHVIEHIRTLADCEVVDLWDIGEGTALIRIGKSDGPPRFHPMPASPSETGDRIRVVRREDTQPLAPGGPEWKYLESRAFTTRCVLAAHFVRSCRSVVEIGGAKTSIDRFLTGPHDGVLVLDPLITERHADTLNGCPCPVSHVRARFQDVEWHIPPKADYGLVMLGFEIQGMEPPHYAMLYQLVDRARVTVIEFPPSWAPSREQFDMVVAHTQTKVTFQGKLDLEGNDFGDLRNSWPPRCDRKLYVLEPR